MNKRRPDMKKKKKGIIIIVFTVLIIVLLVLVFMSAGNSEKMSIVAADDIVKGTVIDENNYELLFKEKNVPDHLITERSINDKNDLIGKKIIVNLDKNTMLQKNYIEDSTYTVDVMKNPVTLGLRVNDISQIACGIIRSRDRIDISVIDEQAGECIDVLRDVYVSGCFNNDGTEITDDEDGCAALINVIVEKEDEQLINEKLSMGELRLCKVGE